MHDVPYGLYIWLAGLLLLIVILAYVAPWWKARRKRSATPPPPPAIPTQNRTDETDEPHGPSA
jgi:hypothetical protein